ncbi:hypothetical protein BOX15_Mlig014798g1 [Macrostomum lignano]|uniref:LRAT domain-containing protein n=1 Tax=Macrostomum lignano TaxID=282301 RepID=A0A267EGF5_9PLAT|nr:hypothetical protein BOX15_Mlig014798g1 [Macrostomum lignano]
MSVFKCVTWTTRLDKIMDTVQPGDQVCFHRGLFIHHAVYVGRGRAIHHHLGERSGEVIETTLEYLAKNDLMKVLKVVDTPFSPAEIIERARSQLGPLPYSLHGGNCEHFTTWVYYGVRLSKQIINLGPYQRRLLQVVKHTTPKEADSDSHQQSPVTRCSTEVSCAATSSNAEESTCNASQSDVVTNVDNPAAGDKVDDDDKFTFKPPRPPKYRPAKNGAQLALKHTRSFLKVLTVQALVRLAAVPLHRCGLQADNLRRIGRQLKGKKERRNEATKTNDNANVAAA